MDLVDASTNAVRRKSPLKPHAEASTIMPVSEKPAIDASTLRHRTAGYGIAEAGPLEAHDPSYTGSSNLAYDTSTPDPVLYHLAMAVLPAISRHNEVSSLFADYVSLAMDAHIAEKYGNIRANTAVLKGGLAAWQLRLAQEIIEARLDSELTLPEMAAACGLSVSHFSRGFTKSMGMAPHRWLIRRRLEKAKGLILKTGLSLTEIALACGFSDQPHMTRSFSSMFGISPGLWRKQSQS